MHVATKVHVIIENYCSMSHHGIIQSQHVSMTMITTMTTLCVQARDVDSFMDYFDFKTHNLW